MTTAATTVASGTATGLNPATASFTPDDEAIYLVAGLFRHASTPFTDTATLSGDSLTCTKVQGVVQGNCYLVVFQCYGNSPTTGALTFSLSQAAASGRYIVIEHAKFHSVGDAAAFVGYSAITQGSGTSGSITVTVDNFTASAPLVYGFWGHEAAEATNPDTTGKTWYENHDQTASSLGFEVQSLSGGAGDLTHSASWTTSSNYMGVYLEILESSTDAVVVSEDVLKVGPSAAPIVGEESDEAVWAAI